MLVLNVRVPGEPARRIRLDRPVLTLGRSSTNDVPLADRTLSRVHARLEVSDTAIRLVDLGSRNGTSLNGSRIGDPAVLEAGDRIQLGETLIDVLEESTTRVVIEGMDETSKKTTFLQSSKDLLRPHKQAWDSKLGAEELARLNASLRMLNEISVELLGDIPLQKLLELILEKTFTFLQPDRGLLMLADESGELKAEKVKYAPGVDPSDIRLSKTLIQSVVDKKNGVLLIDAATDAGLGAAESIRIQGITSCMAAPLFVEDKVIGLIYLEVRLGRKSFSEEDLRLLTSLANTSAIKIQNLRLQEGAAARQRIEREMALAWDIQRRHAAGGRAVLPHTEILGRTIPSRTVSGDYYDFYERGDKTLDVVVADVCGKGMGASLLAASVQSAFQVWAGENFPPGQALLAPERPRVPPHEPREVRHVHPRALRPRVRRGRLHERGPQPRHPRARGRRRSRCSAPTGRRSASSPARRTAPARSRWARATSSRSTRTASPRRRTRRTRSSARTGSSRRSRSSGRSRSRSSSRSSRRRS